MISAVLFILLIAVVYFYATDTTHHFFHAVRVTGRMILVLLTVFLVLGLMIYSFVRF
jgi:predicted PurR-regulated permease PerM